MRKWILALAALSLLAATCGPQEYHAQTPTAYLTAANCLQVNRDHLYTTRIYSSRNLTVATPDRLRQVVRPWSEGLRFVQQISYLPERTEGVDFSESYYDVNQALVSVQGSPIADASRTRPTRR